MAEQNCARIEIVESFAITQKRKRLTYSPMAVPAETSNLPAIFLDVNASSAVNTIRTHSDIVAMAGGFTPGALLMKT